MTVHIGMLVDRDKDQAILVFDRPVIIQGQYELRVAKDSRIGVVLGRTQ